jgi:hypothetical protein
MSDYNGRSVIADVAVANGWTPLALWIEDGDELVAYLRGDATIRIMWTPTNAAPYIAYKLNTGDKWARIRGACGLIDIRKIMEEAA